MRATFNVDQFLQNLSEQLSNAHKIVSWFEELRYSQYAVPAEEDLNIQKLEIEIFQLYHKIIFALEYLGLTTSLDLFLKEYKKLDGQPMFEDVPYIDITVCPKVDLMWHYMNIIGCQTKNNFKSNQTTSYDIAILERILRGTGKILTRVSTVPTYG